MSENLNLPIEDQSNEILRDNLGPQFEAATSGGSLQPASPLDLIVPVGSGENVEAAKVTGLEDVAELVDLAGNVLPFGHDLLTDVVMPSARDNPKNYSWTETLIDKKRDEDLDDTK